ncbi:hypothetical protein V0288_20630 [Pannus brasiliensis CCIBt3594]|uniref:Uncharacterized protein n=1 Tax=Pannus brasiliensis CCIBt3594 TaxID=1427578 RepID=A0AAW9QZ13_9CHRO
MERPIERVGLGEDRANRLDALGFGVIDWNNNRDGFPNFYPDFG